MIWTNEVAPKNTDKSLALLRGVDDDVPLGCRSMGYFSHFKSDRKDIHHEDVNQEVTELSENEMKTRIRIIVLCNPASQRSAMGGWWTTWDSGDWVVADEMDDVINLFLFALDDRLDEM